MATATKAAVIMPATHKKIKRLQSKDNVQTMMYVPKLSERFQKEYPGTMPLDQRIADFFKQGSDLPHNIKWWNDRVTEFKA